MEKKYYIYGAIILVILIVIGVVIYFLTKTDPNLCGDNDCDPLTQVCMKIDNVDTCVNNSDLCGGVLCPSDQLCDDNTELCVDACGSVICGDDFSCISKICILNDCGDTVCDSDQVCDPDTTTCVDTNCGSAYCSSDETCYTVDDVSTCVPTDTMCGDVVCDVSTELCVNSSCCLNENICTDTTGVNTCCGSDGDECISGACCSADNICVVDNEDDTCCTSSETCLVDGCCTTTQVCPVDGEDSQCCDPTTSQCLVSGCCLTTSVCPVSGGDSQCCDPTTSQCLSSGCCLTTQVCGDACCDLGQSCINGVCCDSDKSCPDTEGNETCCDTDCCTDSTTGITVCCPTNETCNGGECMIPCGTDFCDPDTQECSSVDGDSYCVDLGCVWGDPTYSPGNMTDSAGSADIAICTTVSDGKFYAVNNPYGVETGDLTRTVTDTQDPSSITDCSITDCQYLTAQAGVTNVTFDTGTQQCTGSFSCAELPDLSTGCPYDDDSDGNMNTSCGQDSDGNFSGQVCDLTQIFSTVSGNCIYGYNIAETTDNVPYCSEVTDVSGAVDASYSSLTNCQSGGELSQPAKCYIDPITTIIESDYMNLHSDGTNYFVLAVCSPVFKFVSITLPDGIVEDSADPKNYSDDPWVRMYKVTTDYPDNILLTVDQYDSNGDGEPTVTSSTFTIGSLQLLTFYLDNGRATVSTDSGSNANSYQIGFSYWTNGYTIVPPAIIFSGTQKSSDCVTLPTSVENEWDTMDLRIPDMTKTNNKFNDTVACLF